MIKLILFASSVLFFNLANAENKICNRDLARLMKDGLAHLGAPYNAKFNQDIVHALGQAGLVNLRRSETLNFSKAKDALGHDQLVVTIGTYGRIHLNSDGSVEVLNLQNGIQLPKNSLPTTSDLDGYLHGVFASDYGRINDKMPPKITSNTLVFEFFAKTQEPVNVKVNLGLNVASFSGGAGQGYGICHQGPGLGSSAPATATSH